MDALVKGINLRTILKKILWEKEKINWFYIYFSMKMVSRLS